MSQHRYVVRRRVHREREPETNTMSAGKHSTSRKEAAMNYHEDTSSGHEHTRAQPARSDTPTSTNAALIARHTDQHASEGAGAQAAAGGQADDRSNMQKIFGDTQGARMDQATHTAEMQNSPEPLLPHHVPLPLPRSIGMRLVMEDVRAFHRVCDVPALDRPGIPPEARKRLRINLITEEVLNELLPALEADDLENIGDGIGDAIVVLVGTALEYGIPLETIWALIDRANRSKVDPATGKVLRRADGKILKPAGWQSPNEDIRRALGLA